MTEVILSEPPSRMQERVIWIDSEPGVGRAKPLGRMVSAAQIKALCGIGPSLFGPMAIDRSAKPTTLAS